MWLLAAILFVVFINFGFWGYIAALALMVLLFGDRQE